MNALAAQSEYQASVMSRDAARRIACATSAHAVYTIPWTPCVQCEHVNTPGLVLSLFAFAGPAYPWGGTGHHVVALIAEQRLSPEVRERIDRLLFNGRYSI